MFNIVFFFIGKESWEDWDFRRQKSGSDALNTFINFMALII